MEILIRIDWISCTDKKPLENKSSYHPSLQDGIWEECSGKNGYNIGQKHATGTRQYINYNRLDMGQHVVYSSKSLDRIKAMKNISGTDVLIHHINEGHNIARLDLAIDFLGYGAKVENFIFAFQNGYAITKLRKASVIQSLTDNGETLYIGSMKKRKNLVRIYNKGAEQGTDNDWTRVELQIMGKKATSTAMTIATSEDIKTTILGIIRSVIDFPTVSVWKSLTSDIQKIKMSSIPKTQGDTEKWIMTQVLPALARTIVLNADFWVHFKLALVDQLPLEMRKEMQETE